MRPSIPTVAIAVIAAIVGSGAARAGTTIITHGFALGASEPPNWTLTLGRAILRAGGDVSQCGDNTGETPVGSVFSYLPATGAWRIECGSTTPNGEIVLVFDWSRESDGLTTGGTQGFAEAAADALYAALRDPQFPAAFAGIDPLAAPVHFIGHSRGAVVNSDCVERLAAVGILVDQTTTLDPHPVDGTLDFPLDLADWLDRAPVTWNNVAFADNYWRMDGGGIWAADFDGMSIAADVDLDLADAIEGLLDVDPVFEHTEVHAWYHGTVDLTASNDGDGTTIDDELVTDWWGDGGVPQRDATGYYYSDLVGGSRPPPVAGTAPSWSPLSIYNGSFEIVNSELETLGIGYAGWSYHGGEMPAGPSSWSSASPTPGSSYYLTLFGDGDRRSVRHNRLYVDDGAGSIAFDRRVTVPDANDHLVIEFSDELSNHTIVDLAVPTATDWESLAFPIPAAQRGETFTVLLELDGGGDGVGAIVDIDNLRFIPEPSQHLMLIAGLLVLFVIRNERDHGSCRALRRDDRTGCHRFSRGIRARATPPRSHGR